MVLSGNHITGSGQVGIQVRGSPRITGNTLSKATGYVYGAISIFGDNSGPVMRNNIFQCNLAILVRDFSGNPTPDIGTDGDPGNNDFSALTGVSIQVQAGVSSTIYAIGNIFPHDPPEEATDIDNLGTGSVVWGTGPGDSF